MRRAQTSRASRLLVRAGLVERGQYRRVELVLDGHPGHLGQRGAVITSRAGRVCTPTSGILPGLEGLVTWSVW